MTKKLQSEQIKRKLYQTFYRLGISKKTPYTIDSNIYIDDSGFVMEIHPDGMITHMGKLSLTGDFVCKIKTD